MTRHPVIVHAACFGFVLLACVIAAGLYAGTHGAVSALIAGAIVAVFFSSTPVVLRPIMAVSPGASLLSALVFFATKVVALLALVTVLVDSRTVGRIIDRPSLGITVGVTAVTWMILLLIGERRRRVRIYDLDADA